MQEIDELEKRLKLKINELDELRAQLSKSDSLMDQIQAQAKEMKNKDAIIDKLMNEKVGRKGLSCFRLMSQT